MKLGKNKELYDCSIQGFIADNFKNFKSDNEMDYINKSVAYILRYGLNELNPRFSLEELIHNFKNQVEIIVAKKQLENDPNDLTNMHSKENDLAILDTSLLDTRSISIPTSTFDIAKTIYSPEWEILK